MMRTSCFYLFLVVIFILSSTCDSRRVGPIEKKLGDDLDHLIENKEEITKLEASSRNETRMLSSKATIQHAKVNHDHINRKSTKKNDERVSRTWKVPKYSKKKPQEHPEFNLDYMQPTTHPPHHN